MKKSIVLLLAIMVSTLAFAQKKEKKGIFRKKKDEKKVSWGIKAGISTSDIKPGDLFVLDSENVQRYKMNVKDAQFGLNLGAFMHIKTGKRFFIRPELHINSTRTDYEIQDLLRTSGPLAETVMESYHNITFPVNMGVKFGPLRLQGGAIGGLHLAGRSDLKDYDGYAQNFKGMDLGWQLGIGLDIWKFNFDWKYGGDFSKYGNHMEFFNKDIAFNGNEKQMKFAVGWTF